MSLDLIDRLLDNWKNPNYTGFSEMIASFYFRPKEINNMKSYKILIDTENIKYITINKNDMEIYGDTEEELLKYYGDYNMKTFWDKRDDNSKVFNLRHTTDYPILHDIMQKYVDPNSEYILNLGFLSGFIATYLLSISKAYVISIDKMFYDNHFYGKNFVDAKFPGRHSLLVGSPMYLEEYMDNNYSDVKFRFIYIDKSRSKDHAYRYLKLYKKYADENTIILLFATTPHQTWGIYVYHSMIKAIAEGIVTLVEHLPIDKIYYASIAILRYNFKEDYVQRIPSKKFVQMEYKILFKEFNSFLTKEAENQTGQITDTFIKKYQKRFQKYGLDFPEDTLKILKEKFNITIESSTPPPTSSIPVLPPLTSLSPLNI